MINATKTAVRVRSSGDRVRAQVRAFCLFRRRLAVCFGFGLSAGRAHRVRARVMSERA